MNHKLESVIQQAEQYAKDFLTIVMPISGDAEDPNILNTIELKTIQLKIHYLFPQLSEWQRGLINCLFWENAILEKLVNANYMCLDPKCRSKLENSISIIEQKYMDLVCNVRSNIPFDQLSHLQQAILEQKFIAISFHNSPAE